MDDTMMTLLLSKADWLAWRDRLAEFSLSRLPAPSRYPLVAALVVSSWGMQELEPRYMYVNDIVTDCEAYALQEINRKAMSKQYQKLPIVIEAFQLTEDQLQNLGPFPDWALPHLHTIGGKAIQGMDHIIYVNTLEGRMYANVGDYIIRGVKGEVYPCKPDIFKASYDEYDKGIAERVGRSENVLLDAVYLERNQCVALIARMAVLMGLSVAVTKTAIEGWDEAWHNCIYIELPTGQVSWHFHDKEGYLFDGLPRKDVKWDGHSTPEKYERVDCAFQRRKGKQ